MGMLDIVILWRLLRVEALYVFHSYFVYCCECLYPDLKATLCSIISIMNVYTIVIGSLCNHSSIVALQ